MLMQASKQLQQWTPMCIVLLILTGLHFRTLHSDDFHLLAMALQPGVRNAHGSLPPPLSSINIH